MDATTTTGGGVDTTPLDALMVHSGRSRRKSGKSCPSPLETGLAFLSAVPLAFSHCAERPPQHTLTTRVRSVARTTAGMGAVTMG
jgi:hypothetical protein